MHFEGMYRRTPEIPPLLLMVSLQQPHFPLLGDPDLIAYYRDRVRPRLFEEAPSHPVLGRGALPCGAETTPGQVREATAAYYALVEKADFEFGRVIEALEGHGQKLDDWLVVMLSDHGEMLGEHALWEKRKFYEGSARVPMFLRAPRPMAAGAEARECELARSLPHASARPPGFPCRKTSTRAASCPCSRTGPRDGATRPFRNTARTSSCSNAAT